MSRWARGVASCQGAQSPLPRSSAVSCFSVRCGNNELVERWLGVAAPRGEAFNALWSRRFSPGGQLWILFKPNCVLLWRQISNFRRWNLSRDVFVVFASPSVWIEAWPFFLTAQSRMMTRTSSVTSWLVDDHCCLHYQCTYVESKQSQDVDVPDSNSNHLQFIKSALHK